MYSQVKVTKPTEQEASTEQEVMNSDLLTTLTSPNDNPNTFKCEIRTQTGCVIKHQVKPSIEQKTSTEQELTTQIIEHMYLKDELDAHPTKTERRDCPSRNKVANVDQEIISIDGLMCKKSDSDLLTILIFMRDHPERRFILDYKINEVKIVSKFNTTRQLVSETPNSNLLTILSFIKNNPKSSFYLDLKNGLFWITKEDSAKEESQIELESPKVKTTKCLL